MRVTSFSVTVMVGLLVFAVARTSTAVELNPGDILVTVLGTEAKILRINSITGSQTIVSSGDNLVDPFGIVIDSDGQIIVTDEAFSDNNGAVIKIDPETGTQTVVSSGQYFANPAGIVIDSAGDLIVADQDAFGGTGGVIRVNPVTGAQTLISSGGLFTRGPFGIAIDSNGDIIISDIGALNSPPHASDYQDRSDNRRTDCDLARGAVG